MGISGVSGWMLFGESMGWMAGVDGYGGRMVGGPVMGDVQASAGLVASPGSLNISVATRAGITPVFHSIESDGSARLVYTPHVSYGLRVLLSSQETQEPMLFPEIAVGAAGSDVTYRASDW